MVAADTRALRAGDRVELVSVPPGRHKLQAGMQGVVLVADLPFGACSVAFGPDGKQLYQVLPRHLRRPPAPSGDAA